VLADRPEDSLTVRAVRARPTRSGRYARPGLLLAVLCAAGCGAAPPPLAGPLHDLPVPAGEPRAAVRLRVDLTPAQGCEETFDLALYRDRGVDLVAWDTRTGACAGRIVTIRYLPRRIGEREVVAAARRLAVRVEQLPLDPESKR
jgi:hypothetical protein